MFRLDLTPEQTASLVRELEDLISKALSHPSIVVPIAAGLESGMAYLAEEYAVGDSLDVVLRERGPLDFDAGVNLIENLADAIDYAADQGVNHGSLHPRDIIFSPDGVRLAGLGIASALSRIGARLPTRPPYSLSGLPADDVYSLAAIAFEAISGRRLSPANLEEFGGEHGQALLSAFVAATASAPELRPARASEFSAQLVRVGQGADVELDSVELDPDVGPGFSPAEPTVTERFTDLPPPVIDPSPFPQSWDAQPPSPLQAEPPTGHSKGWRISAALLIVFVGVLISYAGVYFIRPEPEPQTPAAQNKPVAETVVDLPPAAPPAPRVPAPQAAESAPTSAGVPPAAEKSTAPSPTPSRLASGASDRTKAPLARGSLVIRSTPADADVLVNGQARGKTPLTVRDLPLGSYTIRMTRDGYAPAQGQVRLTARQSTGSLALTLRPAPTKSVPGSAGAGVGAINVQSRPAGARVYVNDRLIGSTPLAIPGFPAGPATVRIEMDGYRTWVTTVRVNAGEQTRVGASLDRR